MSADRPARRDGSSHTTIPSKYLLVIREHSRESAVRLFREPERNCFTADQHECPPIARRDASSYTIIPSKYVLVIREHPRESAVKLFANY